MVVWDFCSDISSAFPREVDVIVHCASPVGMGSKAHGDACVNLNVHAMDRLLRYAVQAGTKFFALVSSGAVYGLAATARSENEALNPSDAYACSKAAGEFLLKAYEKTMRVQSLRLFYPYGPGQKSPRLMPRLVESILCGQPIVLNGREGRPRMNPLYIDDLVNWVIRLLEVENASGPYNLGGSETVSVRELALILGSLLGRRVQFDHRDAISGDTIGDTGRAREATGFSPEWSLERGLEEVVQSVVR